MENNKIEKKAKWIRPIYLYFFITILAAAVIINIVYMIYYSYITQKIDHQERSRTLSQTVYFTDRFVEEIEDSANVFSISAPVQKLMTYRARKNYLDYADCSELLSGYTMMVPGIYRIDLYIKNNRTLVTSTEGVFYDLSEEESALYQNYIEQDEKWFWAMDYRGKEPELIARNRNEPYIGLIKPVYSKYTGKKEGVACISLRISELEKMLPVKDGKNDTFSILYGETLITETSVAGNGVVGQKLSQESEYSGLRFEYSYSKANLLMNGVAVFGVIFALTAFFAVLFFILVEISERKMFYPVTTLLNAFDRVEKGEFDIRLDENRNDLFREIFQHFNQTAMRLKQMIDELSNERTRRNEFKYRLLQMQIKPHFLYNLFNNMIWMVEQRDYDKLEVLINVTAGYYKTALNYGNKDILLAENQKQLEYYAEIQRIRFGETFTLHVDFAEEVQFLSIPNLLLQPLIENSILHGTKNVEDRVISVEVTGKLLDGRLHLEVWDNGCGIDPETLKDIRVEMRNYEDNGTKYFALVNVAARLQSRYKGCARLMIDSRYGNWTRVVIEIPVCEVE